MAANKTIGGINVTITATIEKFQKNLTAARRMIATFTKSIKGLVFNLKTLGAALAVGGLAKLVANQFEAVNQLKDLSDKTGVSTDKLAGMQLAAEEAGIPIALLEKSLVKLNNEMGMAGDQALRVWIERTSKLSTQQEKLAAATEMFGSKGASMVRFLNGGVEALDEAQKAAESMGLAVTQDLAIGIDRASESFARFKMSVTGIFRALAAEIAPFVELLSIKAQAFIANNGGGKGIGTFIADVIVEMAKNVVSLIQEMVGGVLAMIAEMHGVIMNFRLSDMASNFGMGYQTKQAAIDASTNWVMAMRRSEAFDAGPKWSDALQGSIDDLRKQSEEAAAKWKASLGTTGLLDAILGDAKRLGMGSLESWKGAGLGLFGAAAGGFNKMAMAAGAMQPNKAGRAPALSFAESGSVESYRQQAAIRRQGDEIPKKQLAVQQQMRDDLRKLHDILGVPAANFKG